MYVVEQAAQVQPDDFVVVLDTPAYQRAFSTPVLAADAPLIRARLNNRRRLISLALTGPAERARIQRLQARQFCDETHYPVSLFDLVLNLYAIPLTHAGFAPLRQALHAQWEQTLAQKKGDDVTSALKVFISYSHRDEEFKDELSHRCWQGYNVEGLLTPGKTAESKLATNGTNLSRTRLTIVTLRLLLVSADYLASRFIQEEEQPKLLQRRQDMQLRIVPIIVRPCAWQSEPVLRDLQALPRDNKAVITFSKARATGTKSGRILPWRSRNARKRDGYYLGRLDRQASGAKARDQN